jgi:4'-phosphopantetheinyl transferase EntD
MIATADRFQALVRLARQFAPPGAGVASFRPDGVGTPYAEEEAAVARAVPARRREFAAGRTAARSALAQLGIPPAPIPVGRGRAPVWPEGVTGSIAHCPLGGIVIVARKGAVAALGVDLERDAGLSPDLWPGVLTGEEMSDLAKLPEDARRRGALDRFVAKEALFKAQYPLTGRMLDFDVVTVQFPRPERFTAHVREAFGPFAIGDRLQGRIGRAMGLVLAVTVIADDMLVRRGP